MAPKHDTREGRKAAHDGKVRDAEHPMKIRRTNREPVPSRKATDQIETMNIEESGHIIIGGEKKARSK